MSNVSLLLFLLFLIASCFHSSNDYTDSSEISNLTSLNPPEQNEADTATIYIDSVNFVNHNQQRALLISGDFPDGCTHLKNADHTRQSDTFSIELQAWRESEKMCTQALTPFSFIYDKMPEEELSRLDSIQINDEFFSIP